MVSKLVVAKCWDPNLKDYFSVTQTEPVKVGHSYPFENFKIYQFNHARLVYWAFGGALLEYGG